MAGPLGPKEVADLGADSPSPISEKAALARRDDNGRGRGRGDGSGGKRLAALQAVSGLGGIRSVRSGPLGCLEEPTTAARNWQQKVMPPGEESNRPLPPQPARDCPPA